MGIPNQEAVDFQNQGNMQSSPVAVAGKFFQHVGKQLTIVKPVLSNRRWCWKW